jgi:hypothetical protein
MVVSKFLADERGTYADWRPLTCALLTLLPASGVRRTWLAATFDGPRF